jgi:hypothetical protein
MAKPQDAKALPDLRDRFRLSVGLIARTLSSQKPGENYRSGFAPGDRVVSARLLETKRLRPDQDGRIDRAATRLIVAIRVNDGDDQHGRCERECGADVGFGVTSS